MRKMRSIFIGLCAVIAFGALANGQAVCDVYEQEKVNGLCPTADAGKCNEYCKNKVGGEFVGAECSPERPNKQRECICKVKCCNQGCWGDPHCWTCDGLKFGYQGLKKHYMMKPITDLPNIPYFTIAQINKVWQKGPMAILDVSELAVRDWKIVIEIKTPDGPTNGFILKVNDKVTDIPYRFSKFEENRERFVNVAWGNPQKTQVVMTTSFGLRIVYTTQGAGDQRYTDLSIDTPRHPELKDRLHGLLGRWNGNPDDDANDANGQRQKVEEGFSWTFGDSWIVPGGRTKTPDCVRDGAVEKKDKHVHEIDPKTKELAEKLCREHLEKPEFRECSRKLNRAIPLHKNCVIDLIFLAHDNARRRYIEELVESFLITCRRREKQKHRRRSSEDDDSEERRRHKHKGGKKHDEEAVGLAGP